MKFLLMIVPSLNLLSSHGQEITIGTSIIAMASSNAILLGADTRDYSGNGAYTVTRKISNTNSFFYTFAGLSNITDNGKVVFNAGKELSQQIATHKEFGESFESFDQSLPQKLQPAIRLLKKAYPQDFQQRFGKTIFEVIMVAFINSKPYMRKSSYILAGTFDNWSITKGQKIDAGEGEIILGGNFNNMKTYIASHPYFILGEKDQFHPDIRARVACLISLEANKSKNVGMPADILTIDKNGQTTFERIESCRIKM